MNIREDGSYNSGPVKRPKMPRISGRPFVLVLLAVLLVTVVLDSFYTLKEDQYAVITTFGRPTTVTTSGLKFKLPFIQHVTKVSKTIQGFPLGYRMDSNASVDDESLMITFDNTGRIITVTDMIWTVVVLFLNILMSIKIFLNLI